MIIDYRYDIDVLKGMAILAVVLYHVGFLDTGYLGVDIFLVVNGFLVIPSIITRVEDGRFKLWPFLCQKVARLLPLVVLACVLSLVVGYYVMLPDDFENVSQTVVASTTFSENILALITTRNYWIIENAYRPLMHLWYVGMLMQIYVISGIVFRLAGWGLRRLHMSVANGLSWTLLFLTVLSAILYLCPLFAFETKFYMAPFRFFEFGIGGLVALAPWSKSFCPLRNKLWRVVPVILLTGCILCGLLGVYDRTGNIVIGAPYAIQDNLQMLRTMMLIITVILTALCIFLNRGDKASILDSTLGKLGRMSYSIFILHQVILAFARYVCGDTFGAELPLSQLVVPGLLLMAIFLVSWACYRFIESGIVRWRYCLPVSCASSALLVGLSIPLYLNAGVVRDVPELDVRVGEAHRGMFAEYCDRIYAYDHYTSTMSNVSSSEDRRLKVLVVGSSFARDMANVILESDWADNILLAYTTDWDEPATAKLLEEADCVFTFSSKSDVPSWVWHVLGPRQRVMGIGTKNYGYSNGMVYNQAVSPDSLFTVSMQPGYEELNAQWRQSWDSENYIDFMSLANANHGKIRVFTDQGYFISHDCRHLTPQGARWYADKIDWATIFTKNIVQP